MKHAKKPSICIHSKEFLILCTCLGVLMVCKNYTTFIMPLLHEEIFGNPVRKRHNLHTVSCLIPLGLELRGVAGVLFLVLLFSCFITVLLCHSHSITCLLLQILFQQTSAGYDSKHEIAAVESYEITYCFSLT